MLEKRMRIREAGEYAHGGNYGSPHCAVSVET
jgi:hypothetical protein